MAEIFEIDDIPAAASGNTDQAKEKGKLIYKQYCIVCHGADGKLAVSGAKDLSISTVSKEERIIQVTILTVAVASHVLTNLMLRVRCLGFPKRFNITRHIRAIGSRLNFRSLKS